MSQKNKYYYLLGIIITQAHDMDPGGAELLQTFVHILCNFIVVLVGLVAQTKYLEPKERKKNHH